MSIQNIPNYRPARMASGRVEVAKAEKVEKLLAAYKIAIMDSARRGDDWDSNERYHLASAVSDLFGEDNLAVVMECAADTCRSECRYDPEENCRLDEYGDPISYPERSPFMSAGIVGAYR